MEEKLHYLRKPAAPPVTLQGSVLPALRQTVGEVASMRSKRVHNSLLPNREKKASELTKHDEQLHKKYSRQYADTVTPRFLEGVETPRTARRPVAALDEVASSGEAPSTGRRRAAPNVVVQSENQTVLVGGDSRLTGRPAVSLGSKRLNTLAAVVAGNPLLHPKDMSEFSFVNATMNRRSPKRREENDSTVNSPVKLIKGLVPLGALNAPKDDGALTLTLSNQYKSPTTVPESFRPTTQDGKRVVSPTS